MRFYLEDVARFPGPWADARGRIAEVMLRDGAGVEQGVEVSGQQGGYCQELQRDVRLQGVSIRGVNPQEVGNKEVRANVWASRIEDGLFVMVRGPWNDPFVSECLAFPRGAHDDQVDAVSGAVQMAPGVVSMAELNGAQATRRGSVWDVFGDEMGSPPSVPPVKGTGGRGTAKAVTTSGTRSGRGTAKAVTTSGARMERAVRVE